MEHSNSNEASNASDGYVKNFNQSSLAEYLKTTLVNEPNLKTNNAVYKWVQDLRLMSENECLCVLQAKSIINKLNSQKIQNASSSSQQPPPASPTTYETVVSKKFIRYLQNDNLNDIFDLVTNKKDSLNDDLNQLNKNLADKTSIGFILKKICVYGQTLINLYESLVKHCLAKKLATSATIPNEHTLFSHFSDDQTTIRLNKPLIKEVKNKLIAQLNLIKTVLENLLNKSAHTDLSKFLLNNDDSLNKIEQFYEIFYLNFWRLLIQIQMSKIVARSYHVNGKCQISLNQKGFILNQLLEICLKSELIKKLMIEQNAIFVLFNKLENNDQQEGEEEENYKPIMDLILRTLSILCSHLDSIKSLERINCFSVLTDILCDETASEWTRTEAAGCIAQITSPYLEFCDNLTGLMENMQDLIRALTVLCRDSTDIEIFLIGCAALANITFLDKQACEYLNQFGTSQVLIENYYLKSYSSIFIKDQLTTIMANMALLETCRRELADFNGLSILSELLNESPSSYLNDQAEMSACERVQQKAAIAISRFGKEAKYARQLVEMGAFNRLLSLSHLPAERCNQSDSVLVACLAALRQLSSHSKSDDSNFKDLSNSSSNNNGAGCLMCSSNEESYV